MALVSAHRGGAAGDRAGESTLAAVTAAVAAGCDYVEFDVRLTADGHPVVSHDAAIATEDGLLVIAEHRLDDLPPGHPVELAALLALLAGRAGAHVDLKVPGREVETVQRVLAVLAVDDVVITTAEDASVRTLIEWSASSAPGLLVGLSSSARSWRGQYVSKRRVRFEAMFPRRRLRRSGANVVVAHKSLAHWSLRAYARRRRLPLLVWTVDSHKELDRWVNDPLTWMVTTNHPARALAARR